MVDGEKGEVRRKISNKVMESISIPTQNDFESIFGCDCSFDKDLVQVCIFNDKVGNRLKLTFGIIDKSFGLHLARDEFEKIKIYDEFLVDVKVYEDEVIEITLGHNETFQVISLSVWPEISISIERLNK